MLRTRIGMLFTTVMAMVAAGLVAAPAHADVDRWVAIAYDSITRYWGYEVGWTSEQISRQHAIQYCENRGARTCVVVIGGMNTCASLANNYAGTMGIARDRDIVRATTKARQSIFGGRTLITACSDGREHT